MIPWRSTVAQEHSGFESEAACSVVSVRRLEALVREAPQGFSETLSDGTSQPRAEGPHDGADQCIEEDHARGVVGGHEEPVSGIDTDEHLRVRAR